MRRLAISALLGCVVFYGLSFAINTTYFGRHGNFAENLFLSTRKICLTQQKSRLVVPLIVCDAVEYINKEWLLEVMP